MMRAACKGFDLCTRCARNYRLPLEAIIVPERGIAQARNALVAHALDDQRMQFLAMLDDDEWPAPQWLRIAPRIQRETGADAVEGAIVSVHEGETLARFDGVARLARRIAARSTCSKARAIFFSRARRSRMHRRALVRSGLRAHRRRGQGLLHPPEARAARASPGRPRRSPTPKFPPSRMGLKWALTRAFSVGNSDMRIFLKHEAGAAARRARNRQDRGRALVVARLFLILCASPESARAHALRTFFRAMGKIAALFGSTTMSMP